MNIKTMYGLQLIIKVVSSICKFCGHKNRGGLKSAKNKNNLPNANELLAQYEEIEKESNNLFFEKRESYNNKLKEKRLEKRKEYYNECIKSAEWLNLRQLVLERDNYICQGCLKAKAQEVHHLTYENLENEFTFELISLCKLCHDRIHNKY